MDTGMLSAAVFLAIVGMGMLVLGSLPNKKKPAEVKQPIEISVDLALEHTPLEQDCTQLALAIESQAGEIANLCSQVDMLMQKIDFLEQFVSREEVLLPPSWLSEIPGLDEL